MKGSEFAFKKSDLINLFLWIALFLFFVTVSMEILYLDIYLFKPKINHLFAVFLFIVTFLLSKRFFVRKKILFSVFFLLFSILISTFCSPCFSRSIGYFAISAFTLFFFFLLPIHLMCAHDHKKILRIYFSSFICIGIYAALQFLLSFYGIYDPFAVQRAAGTIARGQALAYEPSFYALYAIPFVMYYNMKKLLSLSQFFTLKNLMGFLCVNFLLVASTSTGAFFGYLFFLGFLFFFIRTTWVRSYVQHMTKRVWKITFIFFSLFSIFAVSNPQLFLDTFFKFFYVGFFTHWSFLERWQTLVNAWEVFKESPLFGMGLGGVGPSIYNQHNLIYQTPHIVRPHLQMFDLLDPKNVLPELLASLGVLGVLVFSFFGWVVYSLFNTVLNQKNLEREDRIHLLALFLSSIVMLFCLQFSQGLFRSYVWLHLGISVGYALKLKRQLENG